MVKIEAEEEYTVLNVELEIISTVADTYIEAANSRGIDESTIIAKILEVVATNDGMIDAILDNKQ